VKLSTLRYQDFCFFLRRLFVAFALINVANSRVVNKYSDSNCYIRYLKGVGKLAPDFPEFTNVEATDVNCDEVVTEKKKEIYDEDEMEIRRDYKTAGDEFYNCMFSELKSRNLADELLKAYVFWAADDKLTQEEKVKFQTEEYDDRFQIKMASIVQCKGQRIFIEKLVDEAFFYGPKLVSKTEENLFAEYCKRKFVVDNNLIDANVYKVTLNPTNLDVTNANCEEILTKHDAYVKKKEIDNIGEVFQCLRFKTEVTIDRSVYWKLFVFATMTDISEENKKTEMEKFINIFSKVDFPLFYSCLR
jgi:hypothetical protein